MATDNFRKLWTYKLYPEAATIPTPPLGFWILWAKSDGFYAKNDNGEEFFMAGCCTTPPPPPSGTDNSVQVLLGYLGTTGLDAGTTNQNVDGSTTPVTFKVEANANYDIHITAISVFITDSVIANNKFGDVTGGLTNGIDLKITEDGNTTYLYQGVKTIGELLASNHNPKDNLIVAYESNNDALVVNFDFGNNYKPGGLRIGRGNTDKLEAVVNDDLTMIDNIKIKIFGYKNIP